MNAPVNHRDTEARSRTETVLTNARLILENEEILGTMRFDDGRITAIDHGTSSLPGAIDCEGDLIAPGLVEMHTDNLEKHLLPRPRVRWPNPLAAAVANDAQMAASGITTVFDAVCAGTMRTRSASARRSSPRRSTQSSSPRNRSSSASIISCICAVSSRIPSCRRSSRRRGRKRFCASFR